MGEDRQHTNKYMVKCVLTEVAKRGLKKNKAGQGGNFNMVFREVLSEEVALYPGQNEVNE